MAALRLAFLAFALAFSASAAAGPADRWAGFITEASARFGVPEAWIRRVIEAESGGRTHMNGRPIVSHAGAMGLMQLMPGTWRETRALLGLGPDPHDPRDNILAGTFYLRAMYDRFGYPGLFAAYNAGPARYAQYLATGRRLPRETVAYVSAVSGSEGPAHGVSVSRPESAVSPVLFALRRSAAPLPAREENATQSAASASLFVPLGGGAAR